MKTIILIFLVCMFFVFLLMNLKIFFYQRTVRKISIKYNISQNFLIILYPKSYLVIYKISKFRWLFLIVIFIFNWIVGICCLVLIWLLPIILPEQDDYSNLKKFLNVLVKIDVAGVTELRDVIGKEILKLDDESL